ncbi:MAG: OmpA family protein [Gammaproteobacteria bacterium]
MVAATAIHFDHTVFRELPMNVSYTMKLFACLMLAGLTGVSAAYARADDAAGCKNPDWAPQPMPGFVIDSCESKAWDSVDYDLVAGSKTVQGQRTSVDYTLKDESKNPTAAAARDYFIAAGKKAGATLMSDPTASWEATLMQKTPAGEFWYDYQHGSGNDSETDSYTLTTIEIEPLAQDVVAQAMPGPLDVSGKTCTNPPWLVKQFAYFKIDSCEQKTWDQVQIYLPGGEKTIEGNRLTVNYTLTDENKSPTALALTQNYIAALKQIGATLVSDPTDDSQAVFTQKTPTGEYWYIYHGGSGNSESTESYYLTTVEILPLDQQVVAQPITGPLAAPGSACTDPPWLSKQFAYFKVDSCEHKIWDQVQLDLPDGEKTIEGNRLTVNYTLTDEKKDPAALPVARNYTAALKKIGATLMSDPNSDDQAIFTQKTPAGEFWYIYQHGSGNDESTGSYGLTTVQVTPFPQVVVAQTTKGSLSDQQGKGCKNPPWLVKQFDYYKLSDCTERDFDSITLDLPDGEKTLAGHFLEVNYSLTDENKDPAALYVQKNYVNALEKIGAKLVSDPTDVGQAVLTQTTPAGELWYIYKQGSGNEESVGTYSLTALQIGGPPPKTCKIEVYGVNFDFDKSDIKPESEPVLQQVLALFTADPTYSAEVGGHTDNVGKPAYNLALSERRAQAVEAWLVAHGVAASRLTSRGYGDTVPLVPNTSDANRAKNRRVELKKKNCTSPAE